MPNTATFTFEDYSKEKSGVSVNIGPLTAANFAAKRAAIDALGDALPGITRGAHRKTSISEQFIIDTAVVTDQIAQRETKWLVTYRDNTDFYDVANTIANVGFGQLYSVEVPTADPSLLAQGSDVLDINPATRLPAVTDFINAFQAVQNSPTGGNEIAVVEIRLVGRSL